MNQFMKIALEEAFYGMRNHYGGPFGAVIVRNGEIIAKGRNEVLKTKDPTAHAEIVAIRKASNILGRFDLSDCEIYSSCEPCPMCFAAIHWAKITKLYYGCTKEDASRIGFDDQYIYDVINGTAEFKKLDITQIDRDDCLRPFELWAQTVDKTIY